VVLHIECVIGHTAKINGNATIDSDGRYLTGEWQVFDRGLISEDAV